MHNIGCTRHQEVSCGIGLCTVWEAVTCALRSRCQGESALQQRMVLRVPIGHYLLQAATSDLQTRNDPMGGSDH